MHKYSHYGLVIAGIAIAPVIAFAVLWAAILLSLAVMWVSYSLF